MLCVPGVLRRSPQLAGLLPSPRLASAPALGSHQASLQQPHFSPGAGAWLEKRTKPRRQGRPEHPTPRLPLSGERVLPCSQPQTPNPPGLSCPGAGIIGVIYLYNSRSSENHFVSRQVGDMNRLTPRPSSSFAGSWHQGSRVRSFQTAEVGSSVSAFTPSGWEEKSPKDRKTRSKRVQGCLGLAEREK